MSENCVAAVTAELWNEGSDGMSSQSSSRFACESIGLQPNGVEARESFTCCMCGALHPSGTLYAKFHPSSSFLDSPSLAWREGTLWQCGWCNALSGKAAMLRTQKAIFTTNGAYPIAKDANRRWMLENLPKPPFLIVASDTHLVHMVWRTPLSLSRELFYIRLGARLLTVRMPLVRAIAAEFAKLPKGAFPFSTGDREFKDMRSGRLRYTFASQGGPLPELMKHAGVGEWWALLALRPKNTPEQPEPIKFTSKPSI